MADDVLSWVRELKDLHDKVFDDLAFVEDGQSPLVVDVGDEAIAFVRFHLPGEKILHLHSVQFRDYSGGEIAGVQPSSISASSHYGQSLRLVKKRQFLNPAHQGSVGFHTKKEQNPWVQVSFPGPTNVGTVVVRNREGVYARRARGLVLDVSCDGVAWRCVYDAGKRAEAFRAAAVARAQPAEPERRAMAEFALSFTASILLYEYKFARTFFSKSKISKDAKKAVQSAVNDVVLAEREREWTSHGVCRSFRFWSDEEKLGYLDFAAAVIADLRELSPDVCFGFGSVLSIVRDHELMKHDDDLDVIMGFGQDRAGSLSEALRLIKEFLEKRGYVVAGNFFSHWHVSKVGKKIDVFVGIFEGEGRIGWFPGARSALSRDDVFPPAMGKLMGRDCPIPRFPEKYLEAVYGSNWQSPLPGWRHNWDRSAYADIA